MECEFNLTPVQKELFDKLTGGFNEPKGVLIFCPPPGMGKSRLMEHLRAAGHAVVDAKDLSTPGIVMYEETHSILTGEELVKAMESLGQLDHVVIDSMSEFQDMHVREMKMARDSVLRTAEQLYIKADKPWVQMNTAHGNGIPGKRKKGR